MTLTTVLSICAEKINWLKINYRANREDRSKSSGGESFETFLGICIRAAARFPFHFFCCYFIIQLFFTRRIDSFIGRESLSSYFHVVSPPQLTPTTRFHSTLRDVDGGCQFLYSLLLPSRHACIVNHRCLVRGVVRCESHSVPASINQSRTRRETEEFRSKKDKIWCKSKEEEEEEEELLLRRRHKRNRIKGF